MNGKTGKPITDLVMIEKMKRWLRTNKTDIYYFFVIAINTGIPPTKLLELTGKDVYDDSGDENVIKNTIMGFPINFRVKLIFEEELQPKNTRAKIFKKLSSDQVSAALKQASKDQSISNNSLNKTFYYHALKNGVPERYLSGLANRSVAELEKLVGYTIEELQKHE